MAEPGEICSVSTLRRGPTIRNRHSCLVDASCAGLLPLDRFSVDIAGGTMEMCAIGQALGLKTMQVADLILPVFAVIVTGWLAGYLGYVARDVSDALIHFAYNVAMPA